MRSIWNYFGKIAFWLSWPALLVYLRGSKRTRLIVVCGDEVLAVKSWLGSGTWGLPGGGLHRNEDPAKGAARELLEESGIEVNATELQLFYEEKSKREHGLSHEVIGFFVKLDTKPKLVKQRFEISHLEWIDWQRLVDDPKASETTRHLLATWFKP